MVFVGGWALPFLIVCAVLFYATYLYLGLSSGIILPHQKAAIPVLALLALLAFAAAESLTMTVFWSPLPFYSYHWLNLPILLVHSALILGLAWRAWRTA